MRRLTISDEKKTAAATLFHFYTTEIIRVTVLTSHACIEHADGAQRGLTRGVAVLRRGAAVGGDECQRAWGRPARPVSLDPSLRELS
jgi:hypothetical protein